MAVTSSTVVEATSLQSVQTLAGNPPLDPNVATASHISPLVLYIARVPGSRDVFLTPLKPREKVVSAEDIRSSLYYVHVNSEEDYSVQSTSSHALAEVLDQSSNAILDRARFIDRPPLPSRPNESLQPAAVDENVPPELPPRRKIIFNRLSRKPLDNSRNVMPMQSYQREVITPTLPSRAPLGPRPLPALPRENHDSLSLHAENARLLHSSNTDQDGNPYTRDYNTHPETLKQIDLDSRPTPGTLTLIRRDPSSDEQWNVASIIDPRAAKQAYITSSFPRRTAAHHTKHSSSPLYLDITNQGYAQFIDQTVHRPDSQESASNGSYEKEAQPVSTFRRILHFPGSQGEANSDVMLYNGHHKQLSVSSVASDNTHSTQQNTERWRQASLPSTEVFQNNARQSSKDYTFISPWNSICRFTSRLRDSSLRCRHTVAGSREEDVSELRFSLPAKSKSEETKRPLSAGQGVIKGGLARHDRGLSEGHGRGFYGDDGMDRLDLSLGREKAGGGFGGKQAKLGKLIIEREGFKMLDLLVAANIALWWRAYEQA